MKLILTDAAQIAAAALALSDAADNEHDKSEGLGEEALGEIQAALDAVTAARDAGVHRLELEINLITAGALTNYIEGIAENPDYTSELTTAAEQMKTLLRHFAETELCFTSRPVVEMEQKTIEDLAFEALNVAARYIQDRLGVTTGDIAGAFFSGLDPARFEEYIQTELDCARPEAEASAPSLTETIERMKREIVADIREGHVPVSVVSFSELHDHRDANCYGGLCEDEIADALIAHFGGRDQHDGMPDGMITYINEAQGAIDAWLADGGHRAGMGSTVSFDGRGVCIINPFMSECGRFDVSPADYGFTLVHQDWVKELEDGTRVVITTEGEGVPTAEMPPESVLLRLLARNGAEICSNTLAKAIAEIEAACGIAPQEDK